ncbi:hypothetical protein L3Q82_003531 [Scortum barcoo]|uniref:Uncharacterized protein n=1 Tax=Scortum barcoo TaxID=214431 RepID=A0ACB8VMP5_9TELE|nr:hypothetical protein L3Q82_003531 [Scortum barcoo]
MAMPVGAARLCRLAAQTAASLSVRHRRAVSLPEGRRFISASTGSRIRILDPVYSRLFDSKKIFSSSSMSERLTAAWTFSRKDTGVIYRILGLDPSHVQDNPARFRDWAVVFGDEKISSGRHYWEVTVKKSQEFRLGVAEALMSRDDCVGTNSSSWVFGYAQRKWFVMTNNKIAPVTLVGKPDRVGVLLDLLKRASWGWLT